MDTLIYVNYVEYSGIEYSFFRPKFLCFHGDRRHYKGRHFGYAWRFRLEKFKLNFLSQFEKLVHNCKNIN